MIYNIDFLIASLVFLVIILYHFMQQQGLYMQDNRTFLWLVVLGILNICFDILCTVLITVQSPQYAQAEEVCLTILFSLQILVPNGLLSHVFRQYSHKDIGHNTRVGICAVIPGVLVAAILTNHWTGLFFTVSRQGIYTRGPMYPGMYIIGGLYLALSGLTCFLLRSKMSHFKRYAIYEMLLISGITLVVQSFYHDILLTGFGITLGITVLFFTLNNPYHYTDSLTTTFDIRYFRDRCQNDIHHRRIFHILLLELSQLKRINNITGVGFGNSILRTTAMMMRGINKENLVFRVTGKRFILMTPSQVLYEEARTKILNYFTDPVSVDGREIQIPVTLCGILNAQELGSSDNLLAYGEYMLSLNNGPQKGPRMIQNSNDTLKGFRYNQTVDQFLTTAIAQNLFSLVYQPVYSTVEKKFTSMECLSRLRHPDLGPIFPDVFIRLAEKNDQIPQIGLLQLQRCCQFLVDHPQIQQTMESVKVNLSPVELMRPGHVDLLIATIRQYGLPTTFFQFEITETVATEYSSSLSAVIEKFLNAGIRLCMDDFGSGYANLNTVFRFPFSTIKLDRSLLLDICSNPRAASLYHGLVSAIHSMDAKIIAEGVETDQELEHILACGVEQVQGYYYSRPLVPEDLLALIEKQNAE